MKNEIITPLRHGKIRKELPNFSSKSTWKIKADAVVIGSGAGGAVATAELSKRGLRVVLLEEGSSFTPSDFTDDELLAFSRLYRDAGNITVKNFGISILQGRSLGGSTTVNWQTCLYPPDIVAQEWKERFGLSGYTYKEMLPYIEEVSQRINAHVVPNKLINANNQVLWRGGQKQNLDMEVLQNNNRNCIGLGRCGLGCPINAKQSMFLTYIPDAIRTGATVITNMRVTKIKDGKQKRIYGEFSPDPYKKTPADIFEYVEIEAPLVILSAGAIEGPALLQRSDLGNEWVGRNLKLHPTAAILARFQKEIHMYSGPPQSVVLKEKIETQKTKGYGFWLEVAPARPPSTAAGIPFYGRSHFDVMKNYVHMNAGIVLIRDGADGETRGKVEWEWGKRKVHYELSPKDGDNLLRGIEKLAQVQAKAGAIELVFPFFDIEKPQSVHPNSDFSWVRKKSYQSGHLKLYSAHPHGSIQAASHPSQGAIDPNFKLFGHKNIFVMDASWYPTGLSANPQLATMSSVLRSVQKLPHP